MFYVSIRNKHFIKKILQVIINCTKYTRIITICLTDIEKFEFIRYNSTRNRKRLLNRRKFFGMKKFVGEILL